MRTSKVINQNLEKTLHNRALKWIAKKVNGQVNHVSPPTLSKNFLGNHYPDVMVGNPNACVGRTECHEVEVIHLPKPRILEYKNAKSNGLMLKSGKRKLWLVFPKGTREAFDSIVMVEEINEGDFKSVR